MKKLNLLVVVMSLFALTPAALARPTIECVKRGAKEVPSVGEQQKVDRVHGSATKGN